MHKRPFRVTLLLYLVLIFTGWNAIRLWTAIAWQSVLNEFSTHPIATVTAIGGAIWMMAGCFLLWSIWKQKNWSVTMLLGITTFYTIWYWSERMIWQISHPNWPFAVIVNLVSIIFVFFIAKSLIRETHERTIKNP